MRSWGMAVSAGGPPVELDRTRGALIWESPDGTMETRVHFSADGEATFVRWRYRETRDEWFRLNTPLELPSWSVARLRDALAGIGR